MNNSQIEFRQQANNELGRWIKAKTDEYQTKGFTQDTAWKMVETKARAWKNEQDELDRAKAANKAGELFAEKLGGNPSDLGSAPNAPIAKKATGAQVNPLAFSESNLKAMHKAFQNRQPFRIEAKDYSTVDSLLPAELAPGVTAHQHEWRILDRLPMTTISAPSYEFIRHNFSGDTGGPDVVAEGAEKPEYVPDVTSDVATVVKIAMHTGISYETLADWATWLGYVQTECFKQIMDKENQQLLHGTGSSGQIRGLFNTSGILTHDCSSDPSTWTAIDSVEASINQLRTSSALAEPSLFITSPTTWSAIRRIKSTQGLYVLGDPLHEAVSALWGVPVLITTACTDGQGVLLDTNKFGTALLREGIVMHQGFSGTDFIQNIVRYVFEERLTMAVERPQAVLALSNLPTS